MEFNLLAEGLSTPLQHADAKRRTARILPPILDGAFTRPRRNRELHTHERTPRTLRDGGREETEHDPFRHLIAAISPRR